ncbi:MAG: hypothetical protein ACK5JS_07285 [Mangrovibacterium sp.]
MNIRFLLILLPLLCLSFITSAQDSPDETPFFLLSGKISVQSASAEGVRLTLSDKNRTIQSISLPKTGRYELQLDYNQYLTLRIQKDGYFTKIIAIDTYLPRHIQHQSIDFPPLTVNLQLIKHNELITSRIEDSPIAHISYQASIDNIDIVYSLSDDELKSQIAEAEAEQKLLREEQAVASSSNDLTPISKEEQYQQLISDANKAYSRSDYTNAVSKYQAAHEIMPKNNFPIDRIAEIEVLTMLLAEQEAIDKKYNNAIAEADKNFKSKQYVEAISQYRTALEAKPYDEYANNQIGESEKHIGRQEMYAQYETIIAQADHALSNKNYEEAKRLYNHAKELKVVEEYPNKRLAEIGVIEAEQNRLQSLEDQYLAAIKDGNLLFSNQAYLEAIKLYEKALDYKSNDATAQAKIKEANQAIKQQDLNSSYTNLIERGDLAFAASNYSQSREAYIQASALFPNESYPKSQLQKIENAIKAQQLAQQKASYDSVLVLADRNFTANRFSVAENQYQEAKQWMPTSSYPQEQINLMLKKKQSVDASQQKAYREHVRKADKYFHQKSYALAKYYYNEAVKCVAWEEYPQERLVQIANLINVQLIPADMDRYNELLSSANEAYSKKDFAIARTFYIRVLQINPGDEQSALRLVEIEQLIVDSHSEKQNAAYAEIIAKADAAFNEKQYSVARSYYNQALNLRADDEYSKKQLKKIHDIVSGN